MKRLFYIILLLSNMLCIDMYAQQPHHPKRSPEEEAAKHTEMMKRNLNLTAYQLDTIFLINLRFAKLRRTARSRNEVMDFFMQLNEELRNILTIEQYEKHLQLQKEHRQKKTPIFRTETILEHHD